MTNKTELLQRLAANAYELRAEPFKLASGQLSHEYLDCRAALAEPETLFLAAEQVLNVVHPKVVAIGGLTMGADPISIASSLRTINHTERQLRWFSVRKEPKNHGTQRLIEGGARPGDKVAVVDDVSTTGGSTLKAIEACRAQGLEVIQAILLVNRGGAGALEASGMPVQSVLSAEDVCLLGRARATAIRAHDGQTYGAKPYTAHLELVANVIARWIPYNPGLTPTLLSAAWLHDVPEDTDVTLTQLSLDHPADVCDLVDACTDGPGANRKARKERPYTMIPQTKNAVVVKLADRIANVEATLAEIDEREGKPDQVTELERRQGLLKMYREEHPEFERRLDGSPTDFAREVDRMWKKLERMLA